MPRRGLSTESHLHAPAEASLSGSTPRELGPGAVYPERFSYAHAPTEYYPPARLTGGPADPEATTAWAPYEEQVSLQPSIK